MQKIYIVMIIILIDNLSLIYAIGRGGNWALHPYGSTNNTTTEERERLSIERTRNIFNDSPRSFIAFTGIAMYHKIQ